MQNFKRILAFFLSALCLLTCVSGCKVQPELTEEEIYALNTVINFTIYEDNKEALDKAKNEIKRLENLLSVTKEDSDIYKINTNPDTSVRVSEDTFSLIKTSVGVSENVSGVFDITVYPAVRLWGFTTSEYKVPDESELNIVQKNIDYKKIEIEEESKSIKVPKGTNLDLGGIAKGYVADKAAEVLVSCGVTSALLNFGGNVKLIGSKPDGSDFKIGIKAPFSDGYYGILTAHNTTISTAGGYERYFEENGKRFHHILNPFTASPAESDIISSTVVGEKGEICDALATSVFVGGSNSLAKISEFYSEYGFIALTENAVYISESLHSSFELTEKYKDKEIIII